MTQKINIREYLTSDRDKILEIYQASSKKAYKFLREEHQEKEQVSMEQDLPNSRVTVIERYGKVVGFASFINESAMSGFFIKTNVQRKGLGSNLLKHIQSKKERIHLAVYAENKQAIAFYSKHGFSGSEPKTNDANGHQYIEMNWERKQTHLDKPMEFGIADTFTDSPSRLTGQEQKKEQPS